MSMQHRKRWLTIAALAACLFGACAREVARPSSDHECRTDAKPISPAPHEAAKADSRPYYVELNRGLYDDPTWWAALDQACRERGWRCEQRDVLQDAYEYVVVDAKNSDVGLINIELGPGVVRCELTGAAAAENAPLLTDFLRHRTRLQLEATGRIEGESRTTK